VGIDTASLYHRFRHRQLQSANTQKRAVFMTHPTLLQYGEAGGWGLLWFFAGCPSHLKPPTRFNRRRKQMNWLAYLTLLR